jgi:hypothetical protein
MPSGEILPAPGIHEVEGLMCKKCSMYQEVITVSKKLPNWLESALVMTVIVVIVPLPYWLLQVRLMMA